ncbi:GrpE protein [Desulforamulus reducens MI-1]|uniref:Protein GrpE n=1 Tax=Desulforamulus reducens (strain ATCC BAA-1160 / DSM 100696 / MI-1) TaxID=349161 RepID=A4J7F4_DESRM|nr:nucleotide exchange factor GrpE [Desulforamulus reducens]ABO51007.1 GrpE protein [Desulforamulus reducens MI-1]
MTEENAKSGQKVVEESVQQTDENCESVKIPEEEAVSLPDDPEELKKMLQVKTEESEQNYNRALRLQADYENLRRRTRQEREDLIKFGSEQLIQGLLPVMDNFERALANAGDGGEKFISGVEMIYRQLNEVLSREGLEPIPAQGEQFDPNVHDAVMQVQDSDEPENTVVEELRKGYYLKGKVIRPSMVKVASS